MRSLLKSDGPSPGFIRIVRLTVAIRSGYLWLVPLRADTWRVCCSRGWHDAFGVPEKIVKGGVLLSGLYDLEPTSYVTQMNGLAWTRRRRVATVPWLICRQLVSPDTVLWCSETNEFKRQSDDYAAAWRAAGFEADCFEISHRNLSTFR